MVTTIKTLTVAHPQVRLHRLLMRIPVYGCAWCLAEFLEWKAPLTTIRIRTGQCTVSSSSSNSSTSAHTHSLSHTNTHTHAHTHSRKQNCGSAHSIQFRTIKTRNAYIKIVYRTDFAFGYEWRERTPTLSSVRMPVNDWTSEQVKIYLSSFGFMGICSTAKRWQKQASF